MQTLLANLNLQSNFAVVLTTKIREGGLLTGYRWLTNCIQLHQAVFWTYALCQNGKSRL